MESEETQDMTAPIIKRPGRPRKPEDSKEDAVPMRSRNAERDEVLRKKRERRVPLNGLQPRLAAEQRPGFVRRYFNDQKSRIASALQAGWEFVMDDALANSTDISDKRKSQVVDRLEGGQPLRAYLMEIEKDLYDEDQEAKKDRLDSLESDIFRSNAEREDRYVPVGYGKYGVLRK